MRHDQTDLLARLPDAPDRLGGLPGRVVVSVTTDSRLVRDVLRQVGHAHYGVHGARYLRAAYRSTLGEEITLGVASLQTHTRADIATLMRAVHDCEPDAATTLAREVGPRLQPVRRPLAYLPQLAVLEEGSSRGVAAALGLGARALAANLGASALLARTRRRHEQPEPRDLAKAGYGQVLTVAGMMPTDPEAGGDVCARSPAGCHCPVTYWVADPLQLPVADGS